ncbi:type II toxin-antitoxin system PemK/MazF family toxin [Clostridium sp. HBUAS56010]|uniref:type II toxin-antitoxin system PemK/MazF family toxin n=1 Tax=Clostridium sp. HBUAS56010 TaxID=2571127 RepID=UPI001178BBA0|nr:type II toxin-antitoxin system PemK/MazF family toxin [Clostridium sp. HBUAS56010]
MTESIVSENFKTKAYLIYNSTNREVSFRNKNNEIKCGEIRMAYLPEVEVPDCDELIPLGQIGKYMSDPLTRKKRSHKQQNIRPVLIVSNNANNKAPEGNIHVIPFTSREKKYLPTHTYFKAGQFGLKEDSILLAECEDSIPSCYIYDRIGFIDNVDVLERIQYTMDIQKGIYSMISKMKNERNKDGFQKDIRRVCCN